MMTLVGSTVTAQAEAFNRNKRFLEKFDSVFANIVLESASEAETSFIAEASPYPRPALHPFQFATERSKRWYFANVRKGNIRTDGTRYIRSGDFKQSWRIDVDIAGRGSYSVKLYSTFQAAVYIVGNRQVPGHRNTGWQQAQPILDKYTQLVIDGIERRYDEALRGLGSGLRTDIV